MLMTYLLKNYCKTDSKKHTHSYGGDVMTVVFLKNRN